MTEDMTKLKALLDYPIQEERLYTRGGMSAPVKALINGRTGKMMSVVNEDYPVLSNEQAILPMLEKMLMKGWRLAPELGPRGNRRRASIQVEQNGAVVNVEMFHPDVSFTLESKRAGSKNRIFGAGMFSTAHTGKRSHDFIGRLLEEWCTNGATRVVPNSGMVGRVRHAGQEAYAKADYLATLSEDFLNNLKDVEAEWSALAKTIPAIDQRYSAMRLVAEGKGSKADDWAVQEATMQDQRKDSAWETYQAVTSRLTHTARYIRLGSNTHGHKNQKAIDYLNGTLKAEPIPF